jgi:CRISPR/Cas system-associated exonuclease Cas4 (RecB family)
MNADEVRSLLLSKKTARSKQRAIGPSEIGGCKRKAWHKIEGTRTTNPSTYSLAATLGTAIHSWIEESLRGNPRFLLETEVERDGILGHVDCFDLENGEVIDWKTTTKKGIPYFPSQSQKWQVQLYGWLMSQTHDVKTVSLVAIPREGGDMDIVTHTEPYDVSVAEDALAWLREVKVSWEPPKPEKKKPFCKRYCKFYDPTGITGCPSIG